MHWEMFVSLLREFGGTVIALAPYIAICAIVFPLLTRWFACNPSTALWRREGLFTDICYWFVVPIFTRYLRIGLSIFGAAILFGIHGEAAMADFFTHGHGPLAALPFWGQVALYLAASDVILYVSHRFFHGDRLWRYHAIHHSTEDLDWISAARFHPVNLSLGTVLADVVLLLAGISPEVLSVLVPFNVLMSALVHANLNWTFGPFKYVLASPVFHRWHHTAADRGGMKNYASTFPVLDLMFGTFYMPKGELPDEYGIGEPDFPKTLGGQLLYPLRGKTGGAAAAAPTAVPASVSGKS